MPVPSSQSMKTIKEACIDRIAELEFLLIGAPQLLATAMELRAMVKGHDFEAHQHTSEELRGLWMDRHETTKPFRLECPQGTFTKVIYIGINEVGLIFWTVRGILHIPFSDLPEDLQGVFPEDPVVRVNQALKSVTTYTDNARRAIEEQYEEISNICSTVMSFQEELLARDNELQKRNEELTALNDQLQTTLSLLEALPQG